MESIINISKALSEENRLRVLMALQKRELCSCEISELLALTDSTVSTHMAILKRAALVESRKEGRWVYYRLPEQPEREIQTALDWIHSTLKNSPLAKEDKAKLKGAKTCKID